MGILLATATFGAALAGCFWMVRAVRSRPLGLTLPVALALLICIEAAILRALSPLHWVSAAPVASLNLLVAGVGALVAWRIPRTRRFQRPSRALLRPLSLAVLVLFALILLTALAYRPNNWDSMTYHLARVAHWIQNRSVEPYPVVEVRQNVYPPGAEYLLLVLQVVAGSDRAANLVQLLAWVAVVASAAPLARAFGARRRIARAGTLLVAAAPMAVLQASSTQNDLIAAALAVALVSASLPLLHPGRRCRVMDVVLLLIVVAAGVIAKPTALLVASPLVAWAGGTCLAAWIGIGRRVLPAGALAVAFSLGLVAPTILFRGGPMADVFQYGSAPEPLERATNALRGALRQLALPDAAGAPFSPPQTLGCARPRSLCLEDARRTHEDFAGNPMLALVLLAGITSLPLGSRRAPARARLGWAAWLLGWLLFHAVFRDNDWILRLELPSMLLVPLVLGAFPGWRWEARAGRVVAGILLVTAFALGVRAAVRNERRPLELQQLRRGGLEDAYYAPDTPGGLAAWHHEVLDELSRSGCRRLVTYLAGDSFDYPITWRAMQRGIEVRPAVAPDEWGCAALCDGGRTPPPRRDGWAPTAVRGFYLARDGKPPPR